MRQVISRAFRYPDKRWRIKDVGVSKEFFDYKFDKIHRIGTANGDKQNIIVRFRSQQFPSEIYYGRKEIENKKLV